MPEKHFTVKNRKSTTSKFGNSKELPCYEFISSLSSWWILCATYNLQQVSTTLRRIGSPKFSISGINQAADPWIK